MPLQPRFSPVQTTRLKVHSCAFRTRLVPRTTPRHRSFLLDEIFGKLWAKVGPKAHTSHLHLKHTDGGLNIEEKKNGSAGKGTPRLHQQVHNLQTAVIHESSQRRSLSDNPRMSPSQRASVPNLGMKSWQAIGEKEGHTSAENSLNDSNKDGDSSS